MCCIITLLCQYHLIVAIPHFLALSHICCSTNIFLFHKHTFYALVHVYCNVALAHICCNKMFTNIELLLQPVLSPANVIKPHALIIVLFNCSQPAKDVLLQGSLTCWFTERLLKQQGFKSWKWSSYRTANIKAFVRKW